MLKRLYTIYGIWRRAEGRIMPLITLNNFEAKGMTTPSFSYPTKSVSTRLLEKVIHFHYPDVGNTWEEMSRVIQGAEYPKLELPSFQPIHIVDIGANIGASALCFLHRYPQATVHCFEPSETNYQYLACNLQDLPQVNLYPVGLYHENRDAKLYCGKSQSLENSLSQSHTTSERYETISLRRASEVMEACGIETISILKIDTEGCEVPILRDLLPMLPQVGVIYVEYHSEADRLEIDSILRPYFALAAANSTHLHRGTNTYLSYQLIAENQMGQLEIKQPTFDE